MYPILVHSTKKKKKKNILDNWVVLEKNTIFYLRSTVWFFLPSKDFLLLVFPLEIGVEVSDSSEMEGFGIGLGI